MHGHDLPDPGRYAAEYAIMKEMGWGWRDLQDAPADLVDEILLRLQYRTHWQTEKEKL